MLASSRRSLPSRGQKRLRASMVKLLKALLRKCKERNAKATWHKDRSGPIVNRLREDLHTASVQRDRLSEEACDLRQRLADCHETIQRQALQIQFLEFKLEAAYANFEQIRDSHDEAESPAARAIHAHATSSQVDKK